MRFSSKLLFFNNYVWLYDHYILSIWSVSVSLHYIGERLQSSKIIFINCQVSNPIILDSLETLWDDLLDKFDAKDDIVYPCKFFS